MGRDSKIEWCHDTGNLWWGCTEVHRGCDNCYARVWDNRWDGQHWGNHNPRKMIKSVWNNFARWQKEAKESGEMRRVFVGSMMDIFEKSMPLRGHDIHSDEYLTTSDLRNRYFDEVVPKTPDLTHLMLTKRPSNITKYIPSHWMSEVPKNIMYGTSPVDQQTANTLIPQLLKAPGKRFLSIEPQLDYIDLGKIYDGMNWPLDGIDWVIVGGESGQHKRPFNPDWARSIMDQCHSANVPFFMKQIDKIQPIPDDLLIREFPS